MPSINLFHVPANISQRPVNWILWSHLTQTAVIVIPEEAESLIPIMREAITPSHTHLVVYSAPITRKMLHFSDLDHYSIPPLPEDWKAPIWLKVQLGLFAGRLYFEWDEYSHICHFLGVDEKHVVPDEVDDTSEPETGEEEPKQAVARAPAQGTLTNKPLTFMQEWLAIRRRGQDFVHTPMGFLTQGKTLHEDHPFFRRAEESSGVHFAPVTGVVAEQEEDDVAVDDYYMNEGMMGADADGSDEDVGDEIEYNDSEFDSDSE